MTIRDIIPPIGSNYCLHIFNNPSHAHDRNLILDHLPKFVSNKLLLPGGSSGSQEFLGWGIEIVEGWNLKNVLILFGVYAVVVCFSTFLGAAMGLLHRTNAFVFLSYAMTLPHFGFAFLMVPPDASIHAFHSMVTQARHAYEILGKVPFFHRQNTPRAWIENTRTCSQADRVKTAVEDWTGEIWDWWPFSPPIQQPRIRKEVRRIGRLKWNCVSGDFFQLGIYSNVVIFEIGMRKETLVRRRITCCKYGELYTRSIIPIIVVQQE